MSYRFVVDPPIDPSANHALRERAFKVASQPDPLNPNRMASGDGVPRSLLVLPGAAAESWLTRAESAAHGSVEWQHWQSARLGNRHDVAVYRPAGQPSQTSYPLLVLFDGESYLDTMSAPRLLDSLIAAAALPPLMAAFVVNASELSRNHELPCNRQFADAIASELVPFLRARYPLTSDPKSTAIAGASYGGLAAVFVAFEHPETFGLALSQSGSFWWNFPPGSKSFDGSNQPGWLTRRFAERERLPIRFHLSAGSFERARGGLGNLETTLALRDVLQSKGYAVSYDEFSAGHDHLAWRAELPNGLIALFRAPPTAAATDPARR
jgi:enterochelin esterase family protein